MAGPEHVDAKEVDRPLCRYILDRLWDRPMTIVVAGRIAEPLARMYHGRRSQHPGSQCIIVTEVITVFSHPERFICEGALPGSVGSVARLQDPKLERTVRQYGQERVDQPDRYFRVQSARL